MRTEHFFQIFLDVLFKKSFKKSLNHKLLITSTHLLPQVKMQYLHFRFHANYFLLPWNIPEEISRQSMLFHNLRQYLPYRTYAHTSFYHSSGLTRNWKFNGSIYSVLYLPRIFADTAFLLGTEDVFVWKISGQHKIICDSYLKFKLSQFSLGVINSLCRSLLTEHVKDTLTLVPRSMNTKYAVEDIIEAIGVYIHLKKMKQSIKVTNQ